MSHPNASFHTSCTQRGQYHSIFRMSGTANFDPGISIIHLRCRQRSLPKIQQKRTNKQQKKSQHNTPTTCSRTVESSCLTKLSFITLTTFAYSTTPVALSSTRSFNQPMSSSRNKCPHSSLTEAMKSTFVMMHFFACLWIETVDSNVLASLTTHH